MNVQELAAALNNVEYGHRGMPKHLADAAKAAGLVIAYGASDDLLEFEGAIHDELDAYEGCIVLLTSAGLVQNRCEDDDCPYHAEERKSGVPLELVWGDGKYSWFFKTDIPHASFDVMEEGEKFCRAIVLALADIGTKCPRCNGTGKPAPVKRHSPIYHVCDLCCAEPQRVE